jgi:hypothetical protein
MKRPSAKVHCVLRNSNSPIPYQVPMTLSSKVMRRQASRATAQPHNYSSTATQPRHSTVIYLNTSQTKIQFFWLLSPPCEYPGSPSLLVVNFVHHSGPERDICNYVRQDVAASSPDSACDNTGRSAGEIVVVEASYSSMSFATTCVGGLVH